MLIELQLSTTKYVEITNIWVCGLLEVWIRSVSESFVSSRIATETFTSNVSVQFVFVWSDHTILSRAHKTDSFPNSHTNTARYYSSRALCQETAMSCIINTVRLPSPGYLLTITFNTAEPRTLLPCSTRWLSKQGRQLGMCPYLYWLQGSFCDWLFIHSVFGTVFTFSMSSISAESLA